MLFRLIGRTTVFRAVRRFDILDGVPCVEGITLDGRYSTRARIDDVTLLPDTTLEGR